MLTPKSIENPSRKSGYEHVNGNGANLPDRKKQVWRATAGWNGSNAIWRGPTRDTAIEAAQDYCDYINGQGAIAPSLQLKSAGHPSAKRRHLTAEQQVALDILRDSRAKSTDPGIVYLVIQEDDTTVGKIGWTSKIPPESRMGDYQAGNPRKLVMLSQIPGTKNDERALHQRFIRHNVLGEWFTLADEILVEFGVPLGEWYKRKAAA